MQYLSVAGPQTTANARAHLASLAGSRCGVVIAVGQAQTDAVSTAAAGFPQVHFLSIGTGEPAANVSVVPSASIHTTIDKELTELAASST